MDMMHLCRESDFRETCYCGEHVDEGAWVSEFVGDAHYKSMVCSCGTKLRIRVDFFGSGHDCWNTSMIRKGEMVTIKTIESKLAR